MMRLFWIAFLRLIVVSKATYLYGDESSPVKEYTGKKNLFMSSEMPRVVEFYSPTCPICVEFKPEYIKLGKRTKEKYSQVQFFAVNCDEHIDLCRKHGIDGYPTLKAFQGVSSFSNKGTEIKPHGSDYTVQLIAEKLGLLSDNQSSGKNKDKPEFNESPVNIQVKKHNSDDVKDSPGGAIMAKQKKNDLDRFRTEMMKKRAAYEKKRKGLGKLLHKDQRKDKNGKMKTRAIADQMTKKMMVNKPGTNDFVKRQEKLREAIEASKKRKTRLTATPKAKEATDKITMENLPYSKEVRKPKMSLVKGWNKLSDEEAQILDVSNAFYMGLQTSLFLKNDKLTPNQIRAFKEYLELLSVSLPPEWRLHKVITDLRKSYVRVSDGRENLLAVLDRHPIEFGWSKECLEAGFVCGFWRLLHTVTVGVAEHRGGLNLIESQMIAPGSRTFSPIEAADVMRNYIDHYFFCDECRKHFIKTYDDCEYNRRCDRLTDDKESASVADWKELATWLWEVHNEISVRLINTRAKKQQGGLPAGQPVTVPVRDEVKALWPNMEDCIMCIDEDGSWHEAEVFKYLEKTYWHGSELDPKSDKLLKFEGEGSSFGIRSFFLLVGAYLILYFVYQLVKSNSIFIRRSVIRARHMANLSNLSGDKLRKI